MTQSPMSSGQLAVSRALFSLLPANCYLLLVFCSLFSVFAANSVFAQTSTSLIDTNKYLSFFSIRNNAAVIADSDIVWEASDEEIVRFGSLNWNGKQDDTALTDTPLEFAMLSYYSDPVRTIRPPEADAILPANNPRLADQKLGAAVFQEMQVLRFLNDSSALARHEAVLKFITDRGNVTRAEVEAYYRNGIRALISDVVDEEFNKVSFGLYNYGKTVLTRDAKNQYILTYESAANPENKANTLTAASVDALQAKMRDGERKADFIPNDLNTVRAQALLIPAVAYSRADIQSMTDKITAFYLNPSNTTFDALVRNRRLLRGEGDKGYAADDSFDAVLRALNAEIASRVARAR